MCAARRREGGGALAELVEARRLPTYCPAEAVGEELEERHLGEASIGVVSRVIVSRVMVTVTETVGEWFCNE